MANPTRKASSPDKRAERGADAETRAVAFLRHRGLRLLERNYRTRAGELDLVMADGDTLVFVEVRYRRHTEFGAPAETVGNHKQRRLLAAAGRYLQDRPRWRERPVRFDVIAMAGPLHRPQIDWIRNAFSA